MGQTMSPYESTSEKGKKKKQSLYAFCNLMGCRQLARLKIAQMTAIK
jgi:hypothetical protein